MGRLSTKPPDKTCKVTEQKLRWQSCSQFLTETLYTVRGSYTSFYVIIFDKLIIWNYKFQYELLWLPFFSFCILVSLPLNGYKKVRNISIQIVLVNNLSTQKIFPSPIPPPTSQDPWFLEGQINQTRGYKWMTISPAA